MAQREGGYYWVQPKARARCHQLLMGRYIPEPYAAVTPWRVEGEWFKEEDLRVVSARVKPPEAA